MTDSEFDRIIREKILRAEIEQCEPPSEEMWERISARLAVMDRRKKILRYVYRTAAAAAVIALGLFIFNRGGDESQLNNLPTLASTVQPVQPEVSPAEGQDIAPIEEQIKSLRSNSAVAQVLPVKVDAVAEQADSAETAVPSTESEQNAVSQTPESSVSQSQGGPAPADNSYRTPSGTQLMSDAYLFEDEPEFRKNTHTSISISSNVSGIAKQDGFIYNVAPSHSPSKSGNSGGTVVEEFTESSYSIPLSFGVQFRYPLAKKLSVGAGLNYTYLQRSFSALVNKVQFDNASSRLHYIGLTASVYYDFIQENKLSVYGRVGGAADKCLSARYIFGQYAMPQDASGLQWSVNAGVGIEYRIAAPIALFVDPSASYYFDCSQPKSIRTEQPLMFSLEAGVRFSL